MKTTNIVIDSISSREVGENATAMSIDNASTVFLMDMLGKLYARPALAVLREYLSNAHDAHVAKGGELPPIEITLPSESSKTLSIRDYGSGVSEEQFGTILSRYGNSTKRDSNEFIGGFGLGAKAGFALGNEFFMTSYQNGNSLRARFYKDAKSQGYVEIVKRAQTTEPDGMLVEVKIPKGNLDEFSDSNITTLLLAYSPESVQVTPTRNKKSCRSLLNPEDFSALEFDQKIVGWIGKRPNLTKADYRKEPDLYAVIGKVVYGLKFRDIFNNTDDKEMERFGHYIKESLYPHAINIPIGSVDLPSSREEITLSERSLRTLRGALTNHVRLVHSHIQSEINKAGYLHAMRQAAFLELEHYPNVNSFNWRGKKLGAELLASSKAVVKIVQTIRKNKFKSGSVSEYDSAASLLESAFPKVDFSKTFIIVAETDTDTEELSKNLNHEITKEIVQEVLPGTLTSKKLHVSFIILTKDDPLYELVSGYPTLDRSVIETEQEKFRKFRDELAQKWKRQRDEKLAEEEVKRIEELRMLHSFFIHDPASSQYSFGKEFYEREAPEEIFSDKNIAEVKYYWSQEELLALHNAVTPAFPYEVEANSYTPKQDPQSSVIDHSSLYHQRLRDFLNHFLLPGARVILLDTNVNLENFKTEHPEVQSGVTVVKTNVETQLKDEHSELTTLRGMLSSKYHRVSALVPEQVTRFYSLLNEQQEKQLHPDFIETVNSLERIYRLKKQNQYVTDRYLDDLLPVFCADIPEKVDVWGKHEGLEEKYPLFFFGQHFSKSVITALIDYINTQS